MYMPLQSKQNVFKKCEKEWNGKVNFSYTEIRFKTFKHFFPHTSMFPQVWKAVNINIKPRPNTMMFNSDLVSGLILVLCPHSTTP